MIQQILILAILGLMVAHLLAAKQTEGFRVAGEPPEPSDGTEPPSPAADHPAPAVVDEPEDDPRDLPWIASWSSADRAARRGQNCLTTYTEAGPDGTTILTTAKSCEAGMPHTRAGDRIIIPDSVPLPARATTIAHELVHIHQRRHLNDWLRFYARAWSFQLSSAPPPGMPASIIGARRSNPDTWYTADDSGEGGPWACWMGRWWPVPIYRDPAAPRLRDATVVWWDSWRATTVMEPPTSWIQFFGDVSQPEHPHEIAACLAVSEDSRITEAGRRLMDWLAARPDAAASFLHPR